MAGLWLALSGFAALPAHAALPELAAGTQTLAPLLKQITPGVVNIATRSQVTVENPMLADPFFRQFFGFPRGGQLRREVRSSGSGVIVDAAKGIVLTNNHVVQNATEIEVTTKDNRRLRAKLIGADPETDIAVLRIEPTNLVALPMGDSDQTEVGDFVLAIGNPFGLGQTVTSGIVSAVGRNNLGIEGYEDFIQTDASINPGNSGGALVDLKGRLIGINTAILAPSGGNVGVGFAIPISMARAVMDQLIQYGKIVHGGIGIATQDITPELAAALAITRAEGAIVTTVQARSPADQASLRKGDVVIAVNGTPVHGSAQLRNKIALTRVGDEVQLTYLRGGAERSASIHVAPAPPQRQQQQSNDDNDDEP